MTRVGRLGFQKLPVLILVSLIAAALVASAGSRDDPEITDPTGDAVTVTDPASCPPAPVGCQGPASFADLIRGWVHEETESDLILRMEVVRPNANAYGPSSFEFHFKIDGVSYTAGFETAIADASTTGGLSLGIPGDGAVTPSGVASEARYEDALLHLVVPRGAIAEPAAGAVMTDLFLTARVSVLGAAEEAGTDRAPNGGAFGRSYTFTLGEAPVQSDPNDTDNDGLNDTWEQEHFGNLDQNTSGDPDEDGLTNAAEQQHGTDPNNPDSDGDGINDGDEVAAGTDPLDPNDPSQGGNADPGDADGDGLNDTWEQEHFGNITAQNGTGDPDGDGLNNTAEQDLGTDPTNADTDGDGLSDGDEVNVHQTDPLNADTDGDGTSDGDEVASGRDPLNAGDKPTESTGNETLSGGEPKEGAFDKLGNSLGYLGISTGGVLGVLVVSLIGLFGRWKV